MSHIALRKASFCTPLADAINQQLRQKPGAKCLQCFTPYLYRARNLVERFFNKIKQCRRVATRYDKLAANCLAFIQLRRSGYGCELMSPRPSHLNLKFAA